MVADNPNFPPPPRPGAKADSELAQLHAQVERLTEHVLKAQQHALEMGNRALELTAQEVRLRAEIEQLRSLQDVMRQEQSSSVSEALAVNLENRDWLHPSSWSTCRGANKRSQLTPLPNPHAITVATSLSSPHSLTEAPHDPHGGWYDDLYALRGLFGPVTFGQLLEALNRCALSAHGKVVVTTVFGKISFVCTDFID